MQYTLSSTSLTTTKTQCLVIGVFPGSRLSPEANKIDSACGGLIKQVIKQGDLGSSLGQTVTLYATGKLKATRIILVNCGKDKKLSKTAFEKVVSASAEAVKKSQATDVLLGLEDLDIIDADSRWLIHTQVQLFEGSFYQFEKFKGKTKADKHNLKKVLIQAASKQKNRQYLSEAKALANGMSLSKDLGNTPGNVCTPTYLASQARAMAKRFPKMSVKVLSEADMKKLGMGSFLSVSAGSKQPAKLIVMEYKGGKKGQKPVALVGKGVTFDTGGISLKPATAMVSMKYDMLGAASVMGALQACAEMKLPQNVVGLVAAAENFPAYEATKPSDIVTSMSGQTIEILNTDAEGRLVLCDTLTYAGKFNPEVVIDMATLTGAIIVALGHETTGLFSNDDKLAADLHQAGEVSNDRNWRLPIWDVYQESLASPFADMANIGKPGTPGSITAACFLSKFTQDYRWAHLDIAGTSFGGDKRGATGRPVPMLINYLLGQAGVK